jgi:hypothetical protein
MPPNEPEVNRYTMPRYTAEMIIAKTGPLSGYQYAAMTTGINRRYGATSVVPKCSARILIRSARTVVLIIINNQRFFRLSSLSINILSPGNSTQTPVSANLCFFNKKA